MESVLSRVREAGFAVLPRFLSGGELAAVERDLGAINDARGVRPRGGIYAARDLFRLAPSVRALAACEKVREVVDAALGGGSFPVRALLFDKTPETNWLVPWHQDLTICVKSRNEIPGFGPWSVKAGIVHVQPPHGVLDRMLAVRIHLDDTGENNGALRVIPETHREGRLSAARIAAIQATATPIACSVPRGGVMLTKPLLLHASSATKKPRHRRVIHLEFACCELPPGLVWDAR